MSAGGFGFGYLCGMFGVVAFGGVIPVVPTGAAVSVGAALAVPDADVLLALVVLVGAAGAYLGDVITYAVLHWAGSGLARRVRWLQADARPAALERIQTQLDAAELRTLLLSRLVPGGRVPVLLAAAIGGYSFRRFVVADVAATLLWAAVYSVLGLVGGAIFPEPWQGVLAAIVLVVLLSLIPRAWRRLTGRDGAEPPPATG
ncbi:MAG TPA: VTT domain-containing protein [Jatrophihabitans sp.]|nr:VTT domain-containing protein [Jatrophihabitans sp.]